jgi:transcriptional regulator with XRE-family HTH domain
MKESAIKSLNSIMRCIGINIRKNREKLGMTQKDLGDKIEKSFQQVQKYESGQNKISADLLYTLSVLFKRPVSEFFPVNSKENVLMDSQQSEMSLYEDDENTGKLKKLIKIFNILDDSKQLELVKIAEILRHTVKKNK